MNQYFQVAEHLGMVRRAWKRAAALAGLAIVCIESLGILTVALLIDWIYQPLPAVRLGIFLVVLAAVAALLARHVVRPLFRKISDDQLALFVEEHNDQFEGALMTAAELNGHPDHAPTPQAMIDAVMRAALVRANQSNVRSVVDFRRLRKYGIAAVLLLAGYGAVCLAFPDTVGRHASRVLAPWQKRQEDMRTRSPFGPGYDKSLPIQFTLSKGDCRLLRRSTLDLQATLSRPADEPVVLNFRPAGQENLPWRALPMQEIEKLNTFSGALSDVDEDLEFCVSSGADRSATFKIGVYDPLKIEGFQITTHYPAYLQLADRTETVPTGDVTAPIGSTVQMRILTNTPLTAGELRWQDGRKQAMTLENQEKGAAVAAFEVGQDGAYRYAIADANGQNDQGAAEFAVRALPDNPPVLEVKYPQSTVTTNPLGEITFSAEAIDDWALAGVELVCQRQLPMSASGEVPPLSAPLRLPFALARASQSTTAPTAASFPDVVQASLRFALEDLQPAVAPEEIISYYLECTDRKGQKLTTDIQMIVVDRFDPWPSFDPKPPHGPTFKVVKNITEYLQAAWKLDQMKSSLPSDQFAKQAKDLADSMIDPESKRLYPFYERKKVDPAKIAHADRADQFIESGRQALLVADTTKAVADFRIVLAELTILKLDKNGVEMFTGDYGKKGEPQDFEKDLKKLFQQVQIEVDKVQPPANWNPKEAKAVEKIKKAAEELAKQQSEVVKKAEQIAQAAGNDKPAANDQDKATDAKNEDQDKDKAQEQAKRDAQALAEEQQKLSAETRKEALQQQAEASADPEVRAMTGRMEDAAQAMREASRNLQDQKMEQAVADARRAQSELKKVAERLETIRQEKLAAAVAEAESQAARLLKEQKDVTKETEATAAQDATASPEQRQRDYKKLTYRQAQLQTQAEQLKKGVDELRDMSQRDAKMETAKAIEDTQRQLARSEPDKKMVNAVVELQANRGQPASQEQKQAEKGLENVLTALGKAADSLAADRPSQLARAKAEATRIDEGLAKLGAKPQTTQPSGSPDKADPSTKPEDSKNLTEKDKQDLAEATAFEMERLARHLADRDFAEKPDQQALSEAASNSGRLTDQMLNDENRKNELATVVRRVRNKLEAEYQVTLQSRRLLDAQREECPPSYRALVNKYYEALSEAGR